MAAAATDFAEMGAGGLAGATGAILPAAKIGTGLLESQVAHPRGLRVGGSVPGLKRIPPAPGA
jgi:hypothetical protein